MKIFGYNLRIELFLFILFLVVPIILPTFTGSFENSLSEYHYTSQRWTYIILMSLIGILTFLDGIINSARRYNLIIGLAMIGVVAIPYDISRIAHNSMAMIFFLGNAYIVTWHSRLLRKPKKMFFALTIIITISLFGLDLINLFVTESIGMFSMAYFMFIRYSLLELRGKTTI